MCLEYQRKDLLCLPTLAARDQLSLTSQAINTVNKSKQSRSVGRSNNFNVADGFDSYGTTASDGTPWLVCRAQIDRPGHARMVKQHDYMKQARNGLCYGVRLTTTA